MRITLRMDWESQRIDSLTVCYALSIIGNYVVYIAGTHISLSSPGESLFVYRAGRQQRVQQASAFDSYLLWSVAIGELSCLRGSGAGPGFSFRTG